MRTFLSLVLLSAAIGCARSDARPAKTVERAPELATQSTSESLPMPKTDVGEQNQKKLKFKGITAVVGGNTSVIEE
jgi:hypothetical protein